MTETQGNVQRLSIALERFSTLEQTAEIDTLNESAVTALRVEQMYLLNRIMSHAKKIKETIDLPADGIYCGMFADYEVSTSSFPQFDISAWRGKAPATYEKTFELYHQEVTRRNIKEVK